jgi:hypothetical protein
VRPLLSSQVADRRAVLSAAAVGLLLLAPSLSSQTTKSLPATLSPGEFWSLTNELSEPGGYFQSNSGSPDNLLSNENELSRVAARLAGQAGPASVYLGVGPEQNFTYIAALEPRIAFILDIRRGNLHLHLLYKALFEMSADRADFVARLFSRPRPDGLTRASTARDLMAAYLRVAPADPDTFRVNLAAVVAHLTKTRGLPLPGDDLAGLEYVYGNFHRFGPAIHYTSSIGRGRSANTYASLMTTTDMTGAERSYLASEANFAFVRNLQTRNLIVPVVGDFAGPKALRAIGRYLRDRGAVVTAFYVSNVESYLQRNGVWPAFCANVATLPLDAASFFIRPTSFVAMAPEAAACAAR